MCKFYGGILVDDPPGTKKNPPYTVSLTFGLKILGFLDLIQGEMHGIWPAAGAKIFGFRDLVFINRILFSRNCRHVSTIYFSHRTRSTIF